MLRLWEEEPPEGREGRILGSTRLHRLLSKGRQGRGRGGGKGEEGVIGDMVETRPKLTETRSKISIIGSKKQKISKTPSQPPLLSPQEAHPPLPVKTTPRPLPPEPPNITSHAYPPTPCTSLALPFAPCTPPAMPPDPSIPPHPSHSCRHAPWRRPGDKVRSGAGCSVRGVLSYSTVLVCSEV